MFGDFYIRAVGRDYSVPDSRPLVDFRVNIRDNIAIHHVSSCLLNMMIFTMTKFSSCGWARALDKNTWARARLTKFQRLQCRTIVSKIESNFHHCRTLVCERMYCLPHGTSVCVNIVFVFCSYLHMPGPAPAWTTAVQRPPNCVPVGARIWPQLQLPWRLRSSRASHPSPPRYYCACRPHK